jgi:hypothetical protein
MSADNVTSIRASNGGGSQPPKGPPAKTRRARAQRPGVHLRESGEDDGFTTYELLSGLHGVCQAMVDRDFMRDMDIDAIECLAMAAKVLAAILHGREEM